MTTVLIVDDQALQRLGFSMLMEQHPDLTVVGEATHGAEAVRMTAELHTQREAHARRACAVRARTAAGLHTPREVTRTAPRRSG